MGVGVSPKPRRPLPPGKNRYPFYRRLDEPQGRSGRAENLVLTGIRSRTVQHRLQSLYRLSYRAHCKTILRPWNGPACAILHPVQFIKPCYTWCPVWISELLIASLNKQRINNDGQKVAIEWIAFALQISVRRLDIWLGIFMVFLSPPVTNPKL